MFILGTICCRGGSKGVPDKNIKSLNGKPLIGYTVETALKSTLLNDLIVSTDSEQIANIASRLGANVPFMRPHHLATDYSSKWDVFIHALESYEKQFGVTVDYLVDMDVTVPLKNQFDIDGAIQKAIDDATVDVVITGYEPERNPYFNMMQVNEAGFAEIVMQSEQPIVRRQDAPEVYNLTPAAYVVKKEALYNYAHWSKAKCKLYPIPRERAIDIDNEIDFKIVEFLLNYK
ncbi:MAG: acylneuraminate cytidylyltransferase family protein [Chitinophagaceae bacterium]|jgi:N-acylneuraminate cytidylyltransferase/CMP-N,N'-diacetyllegionaminic acid synthase|nr:acylneuraminate cytidylyltransferase family protein [Chitinophagaceae bacterium]